MNKAPVQGYEKDVGSRATHRIMYPESATHLDNNTPLVLLPFNTLDIQWVTMCSNWWIYQTVREHHTNKVTFDHKIKTNLFFHIIHL